MVRSPSCQCAGKAASALHPQGARGVSSSTQELEAASVSLPDWTPGGGTTVLNEAAQDVRARLQSQANALKKYNQEFLVTRTTIRVSLLLFCFLFLYPSMRVHQRTHSV